MSRMISFSYLAPYAVSLAATLKSVRNSNSGDSIPRELRGRFSHCSTCFAYDKVGNLVKRTEAAPFNDETHYRYDARAMGSGLAIKHDAVDNILGKTTEHGECYYQYDAIDRLIQADNSGTANEAYSYDSVGNRLSDAGTTGPWRYSNSDEPRDDILPSTSSYGSYVTELIYEYVPEEGNSCCVCVGIFAGGERMSSEADKLLNPMLYIVDYLWGKLFNDNNSDRPSFYRQLPYE